MGPVKSLARHLGLLSLILVVTVVGQLAASADPPAAAGATPLAPEGQSLRDLARLFGNDSPSWDAAGLAALFDQTVNPTDESFIKGVGDVWRALDKSNAGRDLAAPPKPTGDALFDRYALAVDVHINAWLKERYDLGLFAVLPDEELAGWESDFGDDPRYWELRYFCASAAMGGAQAASAEEGPERFLETARQLGVASANTLLCLYLESHARHAKEFKPPETGTTSSPLQSEMGSNSTLLPRNPPETESDRARVAQMEANDQADLALLNEALAKDPGSAWGYYLRAMYWFDTGEQDKGLADMKADNGAANSLYPRPFPVEAAVAGLSAEAPAGNAAVSGAILASAMLYALPDYSRIRSHLDESMFVLDRYDSRGALETWHQFACRFAGSAPYELITTLVARSLEGKLIDFANDSIYPLDAGQQETVQRMNGWRRAVAQLYARSDDEFDFTLDGIVLGLAGLGRGVCVAFYLTKADNVVHVSAAAPAFRDLSQVHYPALALPAAMAKYEAMTPEDLTRKTELDRAGRRGRSTAGLITPGTGLKLKGLLQAEPGQAP